MDSAAQVGAGNLVVLPLVVDVMDFGRIREDTVLLIHNHGVVLPRPFPKLVANLHELVRHRVTLVMRDLLIQPQVLGCARLIRRHDIPGDPALCDVVQSGHRLSERVWKFVGQ